MKCWRRALYAALVALVFAEEVAKETLSEDECKKVVKKVQESGKYTEESIQPICAAEVKSSKCDFFSEALSLASSHSDFDAKVFCKDIAEAHFCSQTMDHVLSSAPVSDLAFGECVRAHETKGQAYCLKFEKMLAYAVQNDDLDTMRACYMIEAYEDIGVGEKKAEKPVEKPAPAKAPAAKEAKIVNGSHSKLESAGEAKNQTTKPAPKESTVGQSGIVVQPVPLDSIGDGKANPDHKHPDSSESEGIITEPEPRASLAVKVQKTRTAKRLVKSSNITNANVSREIAHTATVSKPREPVASNVTVKHDVQKAKQTNSSAAGAKQTVPEPKSSSKKLAAVSIPQNGTVVKKASAVQPHNNSMKAPAVAAKPAPSSSSTHRAGLATVKHTVQQKGKVLTKGKDGRKEGKKEDNVKYSGFLSGFVL